MRRLDKHPRAVAAAQVAHHQVVLLPREFRVQRRHEGVVREADVAVLPADRGVEGLAVEALHHVSRSEEHTSELQSPCNLVCRLLLEKKKKKKNKCYRAQNHRE